MERHKKDSLDDWLDDEPTTGMTWLIVFIGVAIWALIIWAIAEWLA